MCRGVFVVATSVGVVEALKDQGYCKLNNAMRSIAQGAQSQMRSSSQAKKLSEASPSSAINSKKQQRDERKRKAEEESMRTVMYLSTWGPNS